MGSIPVTDETLISIYRCGTCRGAYKAQAGPVQRSCCICHASGTCCHCFEQEVSEATLRELRKILARPAEEPVAVWDNGDDPAWSPTVSDGLQS